MDNYKMVHFDQYCESCKYWDKKGTDDPCDECLSIPFNMDSHKPVNWKEKEK
jgi:hypothetical protein